jgi:hypothetical protein
MRGTELPALLPSILESLRIVSDLTSTRARRFLSLNSERGDDIHLPNPLEKRLGGLLLGVKGRRRVWGCLSKSFRHHHRKSGRISVVSQTVPFQPTEKADYLESGLSEE